MSVGSITRSISGIGSMASGVTAAVVINMNTNPSQLWGTPNIAGTSGYLGGPLWNGSASSSLTSLDLDYSYPWRQRGYHDNIG